MLFSFVLSTVRDRWVAIWMGLALAGTLASVRAQSGGETSAHAVLTNAATVHALPAEVAGEELPVRLEGVVTHFHPRLTDRFFFQDNTDGVYVLVPGAKPDVRVGDRVQIEGVTGAGDYAPVVRLQRLEKLGRAELPKPEVVTAAALATGKYDSRRVEVRGIVRSASPASRTAGAQLAMELRSEGKDLLVGVNDYVPASTNLVDAEVIVRGVAAGVFSWQRQLLEPVVMMVSDQDLEVLSPPQALDTLPVKTIQSLFRYSSSGFPERRVRLRGQLLGRQSGKWLAVRDATSGLFVESPDGGELSPGDEVEVFGFPEMREQTLWLVRAVVRKVGQGMVPAVLASSVTNAVRHPCELHRIEGVLASAPRPGEGSWVLTLRESGAEFEAWLPALSGAHPVSWREGARLAVTGITEPVFLPRHRSVLYPLPRGLRLHARTPADVQLIQAAPWWTAPQLTRTVLVTLVGALLLLGFTSLAAALLARKNAALRETREQLRSARDELAKRFSVRTGEWQEELAARHAAEADFALLTAERTRLARELHDTLEQTLASTALHLDAAKGFFHEQPAETERLISAATQQLRQSQLEVRRSVWNLRALALEQATLPEALLQLGKALADTHGPAVEVRCEGQPVLVPPGVASHLFRIAQEGVTNALKHAQARKIEIILDFKTEGVELRVNDDGCGFDPAAASVNGHFGLLGLKERARALGAELTLDSKPSQGTHLRLAVPASHLRES
jgi:signal transduction histidine kinase